MVFFYVQTRFTHFRRKSIVAIEAGFQVPLRVNEFNQIRSKKFSINISTFKK